MKIRELLLETPKDQLGLEHLADSIMKFVEQKGHKFYEMGFVAFSLKDLPKGSMQFLYTRLRNIDIVFFLNERSHATGVYRSFGKQIEIYGVEYHNGSIYNKPKIMSTLIHELRHSLDHSLAGNDGFRSANKGEYLLKQTEINARFSSTLSKLNNDFSRNPDMSFDEYMKRFEFYAGRDDLIDIFDTLGDREIEEYVKVAVNGIFGRQLSSNDAVIVFPSMFKRPYMGVFSDKRYRRLVSRVYKMYTHLKERK